MTLLPEQKERYFRNIILPGFGEEGQERLLKKKVLLVGLGGLGSPVAYYLAAAGVGTLGLVDGDSVDASNLQRQILHSTEDMGRLKAESAKESLKALNPELKINLFPTMLDEEEGRHIIEGYDFIVDGTDNFRGKYLIAKLCNELSKPYSHGGILEFEGQTFTVIPGQSSCFGCFFRPEEESNASEEPAVRGVLGVLPGVIGGVQATETLKYLLGMGDLLTDRLLIYDALSMSFKVQKLQKQEDCPLCGKYV